MFAIDREKVREDLERIGIPNYMVEGVEAYIFGGRRPGDFLTAVLKNQLVEAATYADDTNRRLLFEYASMLWQVVPTRAWGSPKKVAAWIEGGGIEGLTRAEDQDGLDRSSAEKTGETKQADGESAGQSPAVVVWYPPGFTMDGDEKRDNAEMADFICSQLLMGRPVTLPSKSGWVIERWSERTSDGVPYGESRERVSHRRPSKKEQKQADGESAEDDDGQRVRDETLGRFGKPSDSEK